MTGVLLAQNRIYGQFRIKINVWRKTCRRNLADKAPDISTKYKTGVLINFWSCLHFDTLILFIIQIPTPSVRHTVPTWLVSAKNALFYTRRAEVKFWTVINSIVKFINDAEIQRYVIPVHNYSPMT